MSLPPYLEGEMERRRERLLALLNALNSHPDFGNIYESIGKDLVFHWGPEKAEKDKILEIEEEFPELGLDERDGGYAITVASLLATITDVLCGKRMGFVQEADGSTSGFAWWRPRDPSMNVEMEQRREYRKDGTVEESEEGLCRGSE